MMTGTYPVNAYLYRIKKVKLPNCALNSIMLEPQRTTGCDKLCLSCFRDTPQQTGILSKKLRCI